MEQVALSVFDLVEVQSSYDSLVNGELDHESFMPVAQLCEQWLLSMSSCPEADKSCYSRMTDQGLYDEHTRFVFILGMALCIPSSNTPAILKAHEDFIQANMLLVSKWVQEISHDIKDHHPVDTMLALKSLSGDECEELLIDIYRLEWDDIRSNAIAWDDLDIFKKTLVEGDEHYRYRAMYGLCGVPVDEASVIHKHLIVDDLDQKDFFFYRLQRLRHQLQEEYTHGIKWLRVTEDSNPTLCPGSMLELPLATLDNVVPVHREEGFARQVLQEPYRHVSHFYSSAMRPAAIVTNQCHVQEITRAFLATGLTPSYLITHGTCNYPEGHPLVRPCDAIAKLLSMNEGQQIFFEELYRAYLKSFTSQQLIELCIDVKTFGAIYRLTGDHQLLKEGPPRFRDRAMEIDLGL